ncbi:MAG: beta-propeller fold lactonase family protein [Gemmataceae bacterium]|nr:beta-propeller fold lactonase family protein [Gemmataceae bacterium]
MTLISIEFSLGKRPQNLAITSNNGWLLCANMPGQNVAVFRIDPKTVKIKPAGEPVAMPVLHASCWWNKVSDSFKGF